MKKIFFLILFTYSLIFISCKRSSDEDFDDDNQPSTEKKKDLKNKVVKHKSINKDIRLQKELLKKINTQQNNQNNKEKINANLVDNNNKETSNENNKILNNISNKSKYQIKENDSNKIITPILSNLSNQNLQFRNQNTGILEPNISNHNQGNIKQENLINRFMRQNLSLTRNIPNQDNNKQFIIKKQDEGVKVKNKKTKNNNIIKKNKKSKQLKKQGNKEQQKLNTNKNNTNSNNVNKYILYSKKENDTNVFKFNENTVFNIKDVKSICIYNENIEEDSNYNCELFFEKNSLISKNKIKSIKFYVKKSKPNKLGYSYINLFASIEIDEKSNQSFEAKLIKFKIKPDLKTIKSNDKNKREIKIINIFNKNDQYGNSTKPSANDLFIYLVEALGFKYIVDEKTQLTSIRCTEILANNLINLSFAISYPELFKKPQPKAKIIVLNNDNKNNKEKEEKQLEEKITKKEEIESQKKNNKVNKSDEIKNQLLEFLYNELTNNSELFNNKKQNNKNDNNKENISKLVKEENNNNKIRQSNSEVNIISIDNNNSNNKDQKENENDKIKPEDNKNNTIIIQSNITSENLQKPTNCNTKTECTYVNFKNENDEDNTFEENYNISSKMTKNENSTDDEIEENEE